MLRRLIHLSVLLSAFCLLCVLILWEVSYHRTVWMDFTASDAKSRSIGGIRGRAVILYDEPSALPSGVHFHIEMTPGVSGLGDWLGWGFGLSDWTYSQWQATGDYFFCGGVFSSSQFLNPSSKLPVFLGRTIFVHHALAIPFSYLALLSSILPTLALFSIRRRRKTATRRGFPIATTTPQPPTP